MALTVIGGAPAQSPVQAIAAVSVWAGKVLRNAAEARICTRAAAADTSRCTGAAVGVDSRSTPVWTSPPVAVAVTPPGPDGTRSTVAVPLAAVTRGRARAGSALASVMASGRPTIGFRAADSTVNRICPVPPTLAIRVTFPVIVYGPRSAADSATIRLASGTTAGSRLAQLGARTRTSSRR